MASTTFVEETMILDKVTQHTGISSGQRKDAKKHSEIFFVIK